MFAIRRCVCAGVWLVTARAIVRARHTGRENMCVPVCAYGGGWRAKKRRGEEIRSIQSINSMNQFNESIHAFSRAMEAHLHQIAAEAILIVMKGHGVHPRFTVVADLKRDHPYREHRQEVEHVLRLGERLVQQHGATAVVPPPPFERCTHLGSHVPRFFPLSPLYAMCFRRSGCRCRLFPRHLAAGIWRAEYR